MPKHQLATESAHLSATPTTLDVIVCLFVSQHIRSTGAKIILRACSRRWTISDSDFMSTTHVWELPTYVLMCEGVVGINIRKITHYGPHIPSWFGAPAVCTEASAHNTQKKSFTPLQFGCRLYVCMHTTTRKHGISSTCTMYK